MGHGWRGTLPGFPVLLAVALLAGACDGDGTPIGPLPDAGDDRFDIPDAPREDAADPAEDAGAGDDSGGGDVAGCPYPGGPYAFRNEGDTVPPMSWPEAVAGPDESSAVSDLAALRCDPSVKSFFVLVVATWCGTCDERLREIAGLQSHWEAHGAHWIFIVEDAANAMAASRHVGSRGVTFGWRTNDADNTAGAGTIAESGMFGAVPWTGVIRPSDMQLLYEEPDDRFLDIESIAEELDTP